MNLSWSEATFGCETQALAISLACDIPTLVLFLPGEINVDYLIVIL